MIVHGDRAWCPSCPRVGVLDDSAEDITQREADRRHALSLLNSALTHKDEKRAQDQAIIDEMEARMGQLIQTQGCPNCGGTMYKTIETDENGNPTNESQYVCGGCGHVA
ncbi:hypothetical protein [Streptomyces sp. NPDC056061]|uniref:hypothetical protein n=1 Tax=Streptomyces sp. NPDC056061 TaxID=3345700 RepID=UPI0035D7F593